MRHMIYIAAIIMTLAPGLAQAECYADYKAKQDNPLRLHYGVAELSGPCNKQAAERALKARLSDVGWTLLTVVSVFGANGLDERKESAGDFFLRF